MYYYITYLADDENPKSEGNTSGKGNTNEPSTNGNIKQEKMDTNGTAVDSPVPATTNSPQTPSQLRIKPPPEKRPRIS